MPLDPTAILERETPLDEVIAAYLESVEAGIPIEQSEWVARHPDFADELSQFFADHERFATLLRPLSAASTVQEPAPSPQPLSSTAGERGWGSGTGERFGDYELLEEIARGGMGVVFKARHIGLQRIVALKMIRSGQAARKEEVERFRLEAEAVARLDHPHIVPIYEVGEHDGWHFYSMKLIDGGSLAGRQWSRPLSRESQLHVCRLLRGVAEAVHHAHERGILHRDLKPANILVDAEGQPHVTDFGLAKRIGSPACPGGEPGLAQATPSGTAVGTPSYMAPEQALSPRNATTAADIYSLGCILYELLTGLPPFRAETPLATLLDVIDRNPQRPRSIDPGLDRDLEVICLKCLEKDPGKRYASAAALADDLRRFAAGEPIHARAAGPIERVRRWCKRQPLLAGMSALLLFLTVGAFALITWQWRRAEHNYLVGQDHLRSAEREKAEAEHQRQLADERAQLAHRLVDDFCLRLSEDELPAVPGTQRVRKKLLQASVQYYRQFLKENAADPAMRGKLAKAHYSLGNMLSATGSRQEAMQEYRRALELFEELLRKNPANTNLLTCRAQTLHYIAVQEADRGEWTIALRTYEQARTAFMRLAEACPDDLRIQSDLAAVCGNMGNVYRLQRDFARARESFERGLAIRKHLGDEEPGNTSFKSLLARSYFNYAGLLNDLGSREECLELFRLVRLLDEELIEADPNESSHQRDLALVLRQEGKLERLSGSLDEALKSLGSARAILERLTQNNPQVVQFQCDLAATLTQLGHIHARQDKWAEVLECHQKACDLLAKAVQLQQDLPWLKSDLASSLHDLATVQARQGRQQDALRALRRCCDLRRELVRTCPEQPGYRHDLAWALGNLGSIQWNLKHRDDAMTSVAEAIVHDREMFDHAPEVASHRQTLSNHLSLLADMQRKSRLFDQSLKNHLARAALWSGNGEQLYQTARDLGQLVLDMEKDSTGSADGQARVSRQAALAALNLLRQAQAGGFRDWQRVEKEAALAALHSRAEYREILEAMKASP